MFGQRVERAGFLKPILAEQPGTSLSLAVEAPDTLSSFFSVNAPPKKFNGPAVILRGRR
jgi:hypothetical protein